MKPSEMEKLGTFELLDIQTAYDKLSTTSIKCLKKLVKLNG